MAADKRYVYVLKNAKDKPQFPWRLHVVLEFSDEERAVRFERYLKSGSGRAFAKRHFEP